MGVSDFASRIIAWQKEHGRNDLPWQGTRDPYHIWVSEIMLQQTQVATVIPYYHRFLTRFPDLASLANAQEDVVLAHWSGLGYYARARHLHHAARTILSRHAGVFPQRLEEILALPGIGRSTAAAIAVFAFGQRHPILDGNAKRVLARHAAVEGYPGDKSIEQTLWTIAAQRLPEEAIEVYTQGIMDLGATLCTRTKPRCDACPVTDSCAAHAQGRVAELPSPRPRRALPEREATLLILLSRCQVLLEKRPPTGVWGGLWSLPEVDGVADLAAVVRTRYGFDFARAQVLPRLTHTFTHFRLHIHPQLLSGIRRGFGAPGPGKMWLSLEEARSAPLPAPVRRLLAGLPC